MDEQIDILNTDGSKTGKTALKSIVHSEGLYHNTVHIWFYDPKGTILLAQRSASKSIHPLLWDVSVAGHVDAGESLKSAAKREIQEELNLKVKKRHLKKIGKFNCFQKYSNGIIDNEFHHTYILNINNTSGNLLPAPEEVNAVKQVRITEFEAIITDIGKDHHLIPSNKVYYEFVFTSILKAISK